MTQTQPAPAVSDPAVLTLGTFGVVFGAASTIAGLIISGYLAIAVAVIGLPLAFIAKARAGGPNALATTAVVLNILGLVLGVTAQLMKAFIMSRGG